jgi:hypothetical protein
MVLHDAPVAGQCLQKCARPSPSCSPEAGSAHGARQTAYGAAQPPQPLNNRIPVLRDCSHNHGMQLGVRLNPGLEPCWQVDRRRAGRRALQGYAEPRFDVLWRGVERGQRSQRCARAAPRRSAGPEGRHGFGSSEFAPAPPPLGYKLLKPFGQGAVASRVRDVARSAIAGREYRRRGPDEEQPDRDHPRVEPVPVRADVLAGIEAVRRSGRTNMLDRPAVALLADRLGFPNAVLWASGTPDLAGRSRNPKRIS